MPYERVPWCGPQSKIEYLSMLIQLLLVAFNDFDNSSSIALLEVVVLFILQLALALYRLFFITSYQPEVAFLARLKEFTLALVFFIGIICKLTSDGDNYDLLYVIIFFLFVTLLWRHAESMRRESIMRKLKEK